MNTIVKIMCAFVLILSPNRYVAADRIAINSWEYGAWQAQIKSDYQDLECALGQIEYAKMLDTIDGIYEARKTWYLKRRLTMILDFYQSSLSLMQFLVRDEVPTKSEKKQLQHYRKQIAMLLLTIAELDLPPRPEV